MTATDDALRLAFDQSTFDALIGSRREPEWSLELRRKAWQAFNEMDWPTRRSEEWSRTDIRQFRLDRFSPPLDRPTMGDHPPGLLSDKVTLGGQVTCLNSHAIESQVNDSWARKGVLFGSLDDLLMDHGDLLRPHITRQVVNPHQDRFTALNAAFWSGGQVLYVPRNVVVDEPFYCLSLLAENGVDLGRLLVVLEEGAEATLLCEAMSTDETTAGLHCGTAEVILQPGANLRYVHLQNWNHNVFHFAHQKALIDRDASLQWTVAAMGGRLVQVNQEVGLIGTGAQCQVNGVLFTEDKQHISYQTLQHHHAPQCRSDFLYKAALRDHSRTVWRGMIKVDAGAVKTDGYQRNDNLLLSEHARADSIPGLEIETDDVRCTHGSTSGRVDEELIFYAQCRGYTRSEAIRAIVTGFFQRIFDRITIDSVRDALGLAIARCVREYQ